jgi:yecA family protein
MLNDEQLERLGTLLSETNRFSVEGLDGAFSAAIAGPGQLTLAECLECLYFADTIPWPTEAQAEEANALLAGLWKMIAGRIATPPDELKEKSLPLVFVPGDITEDEILQSTADFPLGAQWALGFSCIVGMRPNEWSRWIRTDQDIEDFVDALTAIRSLPLEQSQSDDIPEATFLERKIVLNRIPFQLWEFNQRRLKELHPGTVHSGPKFGRNDPCPCGSGRKYKKCCG